MKNKKILLVLALCTIVAISSAQKIADNFAFLTNIEYPISEFRARQYDNSVYLSWLSTTQEENAIFYIMRSIDGEHYDIIGEKISYGTDVKLQLLYCFTDKLSTFQEQGASYKLVKKSMVYGGIITSNDIKAEIIDNAKAKNPVIVENK